MRRIRSNLSYANVVATLALFIALGGVSYAAVKLPANSVGEKQIKKNAIVGKKIKKNAITGDKIKPGTIKGTDITLASLGKVPSAANADFAAKAGSAATSDQVEAVAKRVGPSFAGAVSQDDSRLNATPIPLASNGQVSLYGKCYVYSGTLYAETFYKTTADGALSQGNYNYLYGPSSPGYLNTSTPESQRYNNYVSSSGNSANYLYYYYGIGSLFGPDGNGLNFHIQLWAKTGTIPTYGNGAYGAGNVCIFNGSAIKINAG